MILLLNAEEAREYNRASVLQKFLGKNKETVEIYPPFSKVKDSLLNNIVGLSKYIPIKKVNGAGITDGKKDLKAEVAGEVSNVCALTLSYAKTIGDTDLQNLVKARATTVKRLKDGEVLGFVKGLTETITPLLSVEEFTAYSITADTLKQLSDDALAFNNSIGEANVIEADASTAGKNLRGVFKDIRGNVEQFNLLINFYKKDYPNFVNGYYSAAAINYTGVHHTGIQGIVTDSATGAVIEGATIVGKGKNKVVTTDLKGTYRLVKIKTGESKVTVSAPGYPVQTVIVAFSRGKILTLNIAL